MRWPANPGLAPVQAPLSAEEIREHFAFFDSTDYRVGVRAFIDKTKPEFPES
jgi:hypothetical protein